MHIRTLTRPAVTAAALLFAGPASAGTVTPDTWDGTLDPGGFVNITKTVTLDAVTPKIDVVLLVDLSGSYGDDLSNLQSTGDDLAGAVFDGVCAAVPDCQFALASFVDFPFTGWGVDYGALNDYAYSLDVPFVGPTATGRAEFVGGVDAMTIESGYDSPESQYEALYQVATGLGRDIDGDGLTDKLGEIEVGSNPEFRPDATRVVIITTDATMHDDTDACNAITYGTAVTCADTPYPALDYYPGAGGDETIAALQASGIKVVSLHAGFLAAAAPQLQELADETGGSYQTTDDDSADIVGAVLAAIEELTYTVSAAPDGECAPLQFAYAPASHTGVAGGESVAFNETITVPTDIAVADLDTNGEIECDVYFKADDTVVATQSVAVYVPLSAPPVAVCQDLELSADEDCLGWGDIDHGSYDPDGDALTYDYTPEGPYTVGTTDVTLTVTDPDGESDTCTATVTVTDDTPPTIAVGDTLEMWPPNHKYWDLMLSDCDVTVTDACAGEIDVDTVGYLTSAYSDEDEDASGNGDGKTTDDIVLWDDVGFSLRAERDGNGNGRVYGITFEVDDGSGNVQEATCTIGVSHSVGGDAPIDDWPDAGYSVP